MTATSDTPSVIARTAPVEAGAAVIGVHFVGDTAIFVLAEETLVLVAPDAAPMRIDAHAGGILASAADGQRVVTGGDDGKVMLLDATGASTHVATDAKKRWIDHVALGPDGAVAWSAGKTAYVRPRKGEDRSLDFPSTVGGLDFAPKGFRLAVAHYNGCSLWFPNAQAKPDVLEWKGSHLGCVFSPDGKFLISSMQEPMLHGWRLVDGKHMRMSGYASRVRSLDWLSNGGFLATSGAAELILWPFQSKDGPMGKQPQMLAPLEAGVAVVACHPAQDVVATGYGDGTILIVRVGDGAEILARASGAEPVSALSWNKSGALLAFGTEDGMAGIIDLR